MFVWYNISRMNKILYIMKRPGVRYSLPCHGYCNECVVRFRCFTTRDKGLDVTEEESFSCRARIYINYRSL